MALKKVRHLQKILNIIYRKLIQNSLNRPLESKNLRTEPMVQETSLHVGEN